jgi:hypothetical protein
MSVTLANRRTGIGPSFFVGWMESRSAAGNNRLP